MLSLAFPLVLASNSPRRKQLLNDAGFTFRVEVRPTDELFPSDLPAAEVAGYLARHKAEQFANDLTNELILCADTIVVVEGTILNKPADDAEARAMLRRLSGRTHQVITGVCLRAEGNLQTISDVAQVTFRELSADEIEYYIRHYQPFDKAGAYGIQEWIGMVGIERIEGSYYTIMGLPVHRVYDLLKPYARP
jgi:septum formation protein